MNGRDEPEGPGSPEVFRMEPEAFRIFEMTVILNRSYFPATAPSRIARAHRRPLVSALVILPRVVQQVDIVADRLLNYPDTCLYDLTEGSCGVSGTIETRLPCLLRIEIHARKLKKGGLMDPGAPVRAWLFRATSVDPPGVVIPANQARFPLQEPA